MGESDLDWIERDRQSDECLDGGAFDSLVCGPCYEQCGINFTECILDPDPAVDGLFCSYGVSLCYENCYLNPEITCQDVIDANYTSECADAGLQAGVNLKSCVVACGQDENCIQACNDAYNAAIAEDCWPPNVHPVYSGFICGPCYMECSFDFFECITDPGETGESCLSYVKGCLTACPQDWDIPE